MATASTRNRREDPGHPSPQRKWGSVLVTLVLFHSVCFSYTSRNQFVKCERFPSNSTLTSLAIHFYECLNIGGLQDALPINYSLYLELDENPC